jgi:L-iditol 2-dehydrogenase
MELREAEVPVPRLGEALLRVESVGICGSELSGYLGESSIRVPPLVMGHEFSGTLVGPLPSGATLGDGSPAHDGQAVLVNPLVSCGTCDLCQAGRPNICRSRQLIGAHRAGAFAELVAVPLGYAFPRLAGLPADSGAMAEPLACSVRAVRRSRVSSGEPLLILGAGPIGLFALVAARALGVGPIIITDTSAARLEVAQRWGADVVLDPRSDDVSAAVKRTTGDMLGAAIDAVGVVATRQQALQSVMPGGHVVMIGLHDENTQLHINYLVRQEIEVYGCFAYTPDDFAQAVSYLNDGHLRATPDWLDVRPLAAGPAAFEELLAGRSAYSKIVLHP